MKAGQIAQAAAERDAGSADTRASAEDRPEPMTSRLDHDVAQ